MKARFIAIGAALAAALLVSPPVAAGATATGPPGQYYLSLGDSLAFGYQEARIQAEVERGSYSPSTFPGYTYRFGSALQEVNPSLQVVDYGCPGETTISFTTGCKFQDVLGLALHDGYPDESQESAALAFLAAHPGQVNPITVSLGVNDVTPALSACAPDYSDSCVGPYIQTATTNLAVILGTLRFFAPTAEIIVLKYYDPFFVTLGSEADTLAQALDYYIGLAAVSASADTADAFAAINEPTAPFTETQSVCKNTLMCTPATDIHLSNPGYSLVARLFYRASGF